MDTLDSKLNEYYAGKVVRKDLTKSIKEGANVPSYVLGAEIAPSIAIKFSGLV